MTIDFDKSIVLLGDITEIASAKDFLKEKGFRVISDPESSLDSSAHIVIEMNNLDLEKKKEDLQKAEKWYGENTLILSTTLGISATEAASFLKHPSRLIGYGFFGSWEDIKLVELAPALQSKSTYIDQAAAFFQALGKETEVVQDEVGLVFPRVLSLIINEAAFALTEGIATAEEIDLAMQKGTNYPMGPLAWADKIGIDNVYAVLKGLYRNLGEERYRPAPLIRKMVHAGWLGERTGKGFYEKREQERWDMK